MNMPAIKQDYPVIPVDNACQGQPEHEAAARPQTASDALEKANQLLMKKNDGMYRKLAKV